MNEPIFNLNQPYTIAIKKTWLPPCAANCMVFNFTSALYTLTMTSTFHQVIKVFDARPMSLSALTMCQNSQTEQLMNNYIVRLYSDVIVVTKIATRRNQ